MLFRGCWRLGCMQTGMLACLFGCLPEGLDHFEWLESRALFRIVPTLTLPHKCQANKPPNLSWPLPFCPRNLGLAQLVVGEKLDLLSEDHGAAESDQLPVVAHLIGN